MTNIVILRGNVTNNPDLRYVPSGTALTNFSIAINKKKKNGQEQTTFVGCTAFGKTAENIKQYCQRGAKVLVQGELFMSEWNDKQTGKKMTKLGVTVYQFELISPKKEAQNNNYAQIKNGDQVMDYLPTSDNDFTDDVPF